MIHFHSVTHRHINAVGPKVVDCIDRDLAWDIQRTRSSTHVGQCNGFHTDAERRHRVHLPAAVMVDTEDHHQFGVIRLDLGTKGVETCQNFLVRFGLLRGKLDDRRMR